jgi:imidazolonepropionase-like amidohydrolase
MSAHLLINARLLGSPAAAGPSAVLVEGGAIVDVVGGHCPPAPADVPVHDLAGATLMPGMVLCHFHAPYHRLGAIPLPVGMEAPPALQAMRAMRTLQGIVDHGFTGAVSAGAAYHIDPSLKLAMAEGVFRGPRFVAGSRDIGTTGHSQDTYMQWHWQTNLEAAVVRADGAESFRKAVREEIKRGAEIIKLFVTGGHGVLTPNEATEMTDEELRTAIETAHERGARIRGHIANRPTIMKAAQWGIDIVDHGDGLDEQCIDLLARKGTFLAPSLLFPKRFIEQNPDSPRTPGMRREFDAMIAMLHKAHDAGVRIVLGDDYGSLSLPHGRYADELALYVEEGGLPASAVLEWATKNGGEALGMSVAPGVIARGRPADLVIFDGDPAANIRQLGEPSRFTAVMVGGEVLRGALPGEASQPVSTIAAQ